MVILTPGEFSDINQLNVFFFAMSNGISATPLEIFTNYGVINGEIMHMFFFEHPPKILYV